MDRKTDTTKPERYSCATTILHPLILIFLMVPRLVSSVLLVLCVCACAEALVTAPPIRTKEQYGGRPATRVINSNSPVSLVIHHTASPSKAGRDKERDGGMASCSFSLMVSHSRMEDTCAQQFKPWHWHAERFGLICHYGNR